LKDPRFIKPPLIFRLFRPEHLVWRIPVEGKTVFLTFDDGPVPEVTPDILRILDEREVRATFFCVGQNVVRYPELFRELISQGHTAGNHTYHHLNGWKTPPAAYVEDVERCRQVVDSRLFRPPHGRFTPSQYMLLRKKYLLVMWSVLTYDFSLQISPEKCLDIAIRHTRPGSIIVFHDSVKSKENVLYTLPRFLDHFLGQGFGFGKL
jgi:peptidoglycan/xylan/chitin deacetylase (PgdA/CDA1 family)